VIEVEGRPTVHTTMQFLPPPDFEATSLADFMVLGHIMTAMPAVNAIPVVVAAPPGIVSYPDLRLPLPRRLVRPRWPASRSLPDCSQALVVEHRRLEG